MAGLKIICLCLWICATVADASYSGRAHETREFWLQSGLASLRNARNMKPNIAVAKNVILFIGDGMGVSTVTAARIFDGQKKDEPGEDNALSFEKFPYVGLSKTYNQDYQTPDSAGTATAFLCGIKTNRGVIGLDARSNRGNCSALTAEGVIESIAQSSIRKGKSAGVVTSTRVTHATPAAAWAKTPNRDWESDRNVLSAGCTTVKDIAMQLVEDNKDFQVVMGGGRGKFLKNTTADPEDAGSTGERWDRDLPEYWEQIQSSMGRTAKYMWSREDFDNLDIENTDSVLGLFSRSHMDYEADRVPTNEPSLAEMTDKAIRLLRKNDKGFFLIVEGGRIDHAHHASNAYKSLEDTRIFAAAVQTAMDLTDEKDTLIVTSADHSHVFTIGGYPSRGNNILGLTDNGAGESVLARDDRTYTTLLYANGPGAFASTDAATRPNATADEVVNKEYKQQATVPLSSETHAAEDVAIYARGPMSHLFHGVHEQHYIAHVMAYASCVGIYSDSYDCAQKDVDDNETDNSVNSATMTRVNALCVVLLACLIFMGVRL